MTNNKKKSKKTNNKLKELNEPRHALNRKKLLKEEATSKVEEKIIKEKIEEIKKEVFEESKEIDNIDLNIEENKETIIRKILPKEKIKYKRIFVDLSIPLVLINISILLYFVILAPKIELIGKNNITMEVNSTYKDKGYKVTYLGKKVNTKVKKIGKINTKKIGTYKVIYTTKYRNRRAKITKKIIIEDKEKPIIQLTGKDNTMVCSNTKYKEEGYTAKDNYDGNLTKKVKTITEDDKITYVVNDSSNNETKKIRKLTYGDKTKPIIKLNGGESITIMVGSNYEEAGYTVTDNCDGDITDKLEKSGSVQTNTIGNYEILYKVKDSKNNETVVKRNVKVVNKLGVGKVIYLTFDDGPSSITNGILDILKQEDVKATFFVTGKTNNYQVVLKREAFEGNTIGLHTYSHIYSDIYASTMAYFNDLNRIRDSVYNITGIQSNIIRFPGGSSNNVSKHYQIGLMSTLVKEVTYRGYKYFDWNVSCEDAGGARNSVDVYNNVVNNLKYSSNVVLMHDFEGNYKTLNALKDIIEYGKANGYSFAAISDSTPPVHHRVNN